MILLDANAVIWIVQRHRRARRLENVARLYISPATLLELQFLRELGRLRLREGLTIEALADDPRWRLDEPPAARWFAIAGELAWTRDPFDRLVAAHARLRRWRIATGDAHMQEHLPASDILAL